MFHHFFMLPASESFFSKAILADSDQQLLTVVDALISYCSDCNKHVSNINNNDKTVHVDVSPQNISSKLISLIDPDNEYWDVNKPVYLQLVSCLQNIFIIIIVTIIILIKSNKYMVFMILFNSFLISDSCTTWWKVYVPGVMQ